MKRWADGSSSSGRRIQAAAVRAIDAHLRIQAWASRVVDDFSEEEDTIPEADPIDMLATTRRRSIVSG